MDQAQTAQLIDWDPTRLLWADVSHWHRLTDAGAYARANKAGLLGVKVSQNGVEAALEHPMIQAAEAAGLIIVGYEYGDIAPEEFLGLFPPKAGRIPCLDFEGASITVEMAEAWIQAVRAAYGRAPWFYSGINWVQAGSPVGTTIAGCPWWGPRYGATLRVLRGVGKPTAWQYSDMGAGAPAGAPLDHPGVQGYCDMSALLVDLDELQEMAGLHYSTPPPPVQTPVRTPVQAATDLFVVLTQAAQAGNVLAFGTAAQPSSVVRAAQTDMGGLVADGIYGPKTQARGAALLMRPFPTRPPG